MELLAGKHSLKNGWVLDISECYGSYKISKPGAYGIWATRTTGGQWGDGIWSLSLINDREEDGEPLDVGFTMEDCNKIVDRMETLIDKYKIKVYKVESNCKSEEANCKSEKTNWFRRLWSKLSR